MPTPAADRPFVLHLLRQDEAPGGYFRPGAHIAFTPALRTSGLLSALSGEDLKSLLLVLTFASANGHVQPSLIEMAKALRQPQGVTRAQMRRLERFLWQGKPLLHELRRESGLHAFSPSPRILGIEHAHPRPAQMSGTAPTYPAAGREAVIAHSRATYTRTRAEAERQVAQANGWEWPFLPLGERQAILRQKTQEVEGGTPQPQARQTSDAVNPSPMDTRFPTLPSPDEIPNADLRRDLATWGVPSDLIERLLSDHDPASIRNQVDWLPLRSANDPARFLVAAIQKDYAPPASVRKRQALEQAMRGLADRTQPGEGTQDAAATRLPLP